MSRDLEYWRECLTLAAEDFGISLTPDQIEHLADAVSGAHECYGMAFYSPPWSDRASDIEDELKKKLKDLRAEFDAYRNNAETAVKRALRQYADARVTIGECGEVLRHGGQTERIQ